MSSPTSPAAPTSRGRRRRAAVLDAAAELFLARGFHGTSIDEIGERAGISGPGVYRHFASKEAVLAAVLDRLWERVRPALSAADDTEEPTAALEALVEAHVDLALDEPRALVLLVRERRHLSRAGRSSNARRHGRYVAGWVAALRAAAGDLDEPEARSVALAVHGLLDSAAAHPHVLERHRRRAQLVGLARAALTAAGVPAGRGAEPASP